MSPQDSFIDEDEDSCPLCVEEFDLSDKNFRPCPCGYQICQFCFNNIKNNINGLCPACRRPYDEKTIEWKVVTPEEIAQFKANVQKNAKKKQEQRQREAQKREVESQNRKHLSGLRVVQKNLVYVVGISPGIPEQEILSTLRGEKYFGQYGKIVKIVVSNKKQGDSGSNGQSLGVYVTFARKEDAARCIAAVNGSQNGDRVLRAQLGTTKYCSAYLRNETCTNKNCMFLHEPGDNDDSYSRQDLSSINSVNQQRPFSSIVSGAATSSRQPAPAQPSSLPAQAMTREGSKEGSDNGDGSALPSSASWANRGLPQRSRRGSHSTTGAAPSPAVSHALPVTMEVVEEPSEQSKQSKSETPGPASSEAANITMDKPFEKDLVLTSLLKAINSSSLSFPPPKPIEEVDNYTLYPPLFDERGGEKRRALREQHEEAPLQAIKEFQEDIHSVPELLEDEEPESGSLQLGGEPEGREIGREATLPSNFHGQRQSSSQLPIQRIANTGPFGPRLGQTYSKNLSSLSSINGRTLTPLQQQQLLLIKSGQQSEFVDQYPPGIGSQLGQNSTLFQQQGHGRQASRYNFSNEASSAISIKTSANSKLVSQQSSMMPSANHSQQGGFYPPIQGPPPGLKSSSTPPTNSSMFPQNLGLGNSISGTLLSGLQKENNSDMIRDMIRGRGAISGSQAHDTGKREYMFPSFLHQYPSASSTPAPAPGMASIYGPQTGAFHDFGHKQKKKGKKHRHVNTSSSGGGGLVDLADPSILQARMQHQQQSNAGVGQGLFGGQAQDDQLLPSFDDAQSSVDALVRDIADEDFGRTFPAFSQVSRCPTPIIPPGFGLPNVNSSVVLRDEPIPRSNSRIVPTSAPFTPRRNLSSIVSPINLPLSASSRNSFPNCVEVTSLSQKEAKSLSVSLKSSKALSTQQEIQSDNPPILESQKGKIISPSASGKLVLPASQSIVTKQSNSAVIAQTKQLSCELQSTPNLNNFVPTKSNSIGTAVVESSKKANAFPPLPLGSNSAAHAQIPRNISKTLRVTSIPKSETLANVSTSSSTVSSTIPSQPPISRQPSITSNARLESPGTPTSEVISDNISITSTSLSRASSPPPTRVGSAPIRTTTKSSQKKQRQAQKEKDRAGIEAAATAEAEVEIGPIMGRKKKQKKDRLHNFPSGTTLTISRPQTPGNLGGELIKESSSIEVKSETEAREPSVQSDTLITESMTPDSKANDKDKTPTAIKPDHSFDESKAEAEPVTRPPPTPAAIFQNFLSTGVIKDVNELYLLKTVTSSYRHTDVLDKLSKKEISPKLTITPEDHETLLDGKPVHKFSEGGHRIMLTPNGDCVRNLTQEEEERYLDYQARLAKDSGPTSFVSAKHCGQNGFTMIGGRAVPSGPPSFFPSPNKGNGLDAVSKIQRDEALNYINQYVLPTLSSNTQLDKAFNGNVVQGDVMCSDSADTTWRSWSTDQTSNPSGNNDFYMSHAPNSEGMIENITTHFAIGDMGRQGSGSLLSLSDAESAMQVARKEADSLEKRLNALIKKNRRLLLGSGH